jgi:hypothetical protein
MLCSRTRGAIRSSKFPRQMREMREIRCEVRPAQLSAAAVSGLLTRGDDLDLEEIFGPHQLWSDK